MAMDPVVLKKMRIEEADRKMREMQVSLFDIEEEGQHGNTQK